MFSVFMVGRRIEGNVSEQIQPVMSNTPLISLLSSNLEFVSPKVMPWYSSAVLYNHLSVIPLMAVIDKLVWIRTSLSVWFNQTL